MISDSSSRLTTAVPGTTPVVVLQGANKSEQVTIPSYHPVVATLH